MAVALVVVGGITSLVKPSFSICRNCAVPLFLERLASSAVEIGAMIGALKPRYVHQPSSAKT